MLKIKFIADYGQIKELFNENGMTKLAKMITYDGKWIEKASLPQMKALAVGIHELKMQDLIKAELYNIDFDSEVLNVNYECDDILKKIFLLDLSEQWEVPTSLDYALKAFELARPIESRFRKSVLYFLDNEVEEAVLELFTSFQIYGLRFRVNIYNRMQKFYGKDIKLGDSKGSWERVLNSERLQELLRNKDEEKVAKDELVGLFNIMPNMQDSIIPILIFEGVKLSKIEEDDEVRYIRSSQVSDGKLTLEAGGDKKKARVIEIDNDVQVMIEKAMTQKMMLRVIKHNKHLVEMADTPYLLRPALGVRSRDDEVEAMSYTGTISRLLNCKEQFEAAFMTHKTFTPKLLERCGKAYYVNKYMEQGKTLDQSIIKTCKRFGDWTYTDDESREHLLDANRQRTYRLRKIWEVFYEESGKAQQA